MYSSGIIATATTTIIIIIAVFDRRNVDFSVFTHDRSRTCSRPTRVDIIIRVLHSSVEIYTYIYVCLKMTAGEMFSSKWWLSRVITNTRAPYSHVTAGANHNIARVVRHIERLVLLLFLRNFFFSLHSDVTVVQHNNIRVYLRALLFGPRAPVKRFIVFIVFLYFFFRLRRAPAKFRTPKRVNAQISTLATTVRVYII